MNCAEARELFDLHVDGALQAPASRSLEDHLRQCPSCRAAYDAVQAESELLRQALQADLSSAAEIARIEARIQERIRPAGALLTALGEGVLPALGILLGLFALVWGRFDAAGLREAICLSLNPRGGLTVAIPSVLVAALVVLTVVMIQPLMLRRSQH